MRKTLLLALALAGTGCGGTETSEPAKPEVPAAEQETAQEAPKKQEEAAGKEAEPKGEPENRKSLELLSVRGGAQAAGLRSERSGMYQEFRNLKPEQRKAVSAIIDPLQYFQWSSKKEDMLAAPGKIIGFIDQCLEAGSKFKEAGEAAHATVTQWETELTEGKKRHKASKVEEMKEERNSQMKGYRSLNLIVRSLIDEAVIYGRFGSWAMQDELKSAFLARKEKLKDDSQVANALDTLFMVVGVPPEQR